ncbi:FecR family protein [Marinifilum sp.]|uniref:FecR family protein n=1 Tax=Marinifilum sp. TaxID=2033137 RepID=UPI003BA8C6A1
MGKKDIHIILVRFFSQEAEREEISILENWLKEDENKKEFDQLEKLWFASESKESLSIDQKYSKAKYLNFIRSNRSKTAITRKLTMNILKIAAIFTGVILGAYLLYDYSNGLIPQVVEFSEMEAPKYDDAIIKTETGKIVKLGTDEQKELKATDGTLVKKHLGEDVTYHPESQQKKGAVMHELGVPRGKRVDLVLADGTKVWLNSESVLKYPTYFDGDERIVLLEGEAFFDVAKNRNMPFIVKTSDLNVRVLGTEFNLSSYKSEKNIELTLEEGSVGLYKKGQLFNPEKAVRVKPNQKASFNKTLNRNVKLIACNPEIYSSWRFGKLQFRHENFGVLIRKLERWFDVRIINDNKEIDDIAFSGDFDNEDIHQVMETIKRNAGIKYELSGDEIRILP